jgi:peroxiredoxin
MKRKKNNEIFFFAGVIVVIIIIIVMIMVPDRKDPSITDNNTPAEPNNAITLAASNTPVTPVVEQDPNDLTPSVTLPKVVLSDLIDAADAWMPCAEHKAWIDKPAPDFEITDIDGKKHSLSKYRGKSIIINLWSPWFTPTHKELETLIQLRQAVEADKLMILGVSFDSDVTVKRFVNKKMAINFPIVSVSGQQSLPAPYSTAKPYPCSMFITSDGILKMSTRGSMPLADFQAMLIAE